MFTQYISKYGKSLDGTYKLLLVTINTNINITKNGFLMYISYSKNRHIYIIKFL